MKRFIAFILSIILGLSFTVSLAAALPAPQSIVQFGVYPQGASGEVLPINWKVLEIKDNIAYLMSKNILFAARIHHDQRKYPGFAKSELNGILNGEFLNSAFTQEEQKALFESEFGFVSLPSVEDLKNPDFGFKSNKDRCTFIGTDYAVNNGLFRYSSRPYSPIWTRTESDKKHANRSTKVKGNIGFIGVESEDLGVMPVIWLNLDNVNMVSGTGLEDLPLVLEVKP
ncbi:MAG: hypothetical protein Q4E07_04270 [Eubacteriales bacterium]|nr:hypothetical protein [Eubacteriales bacterium]